MSFDPDRPLRQQLNDIANEALARPVSWLARHRAFLSRQRSQVGTMGGYWGGIVMRALAFIRRTGATATAFLRRRP